MGTRPNFVKMAPVIRALSRHQGRFESILVHTGQHYDHAMSEVFFEELGVRRPDYLLGVGSGTHAQQTARVMERLEPLLIQLRPDLVLVPGDVNSTLAAALTAAKHGIPIGHIEAGLRSFDRSMPEEINRLLTDQLADLLFTHSPEAREHLLAEGRDERDIHAVGNTMIDTLAILRSAIEREAAALRFGLVPGEFLLVTLHRPTLVDGPLLAETLNALNQITPSVEVLFPVHPRTRARLGDHGPEPGRVRLIEPLGYLAFLSLVSQSAGVLTDSGGIQEETTYLGVPCFTLRNNTERPITCTVGTNHLLGLDPARIVEIPTLLSRLDDADRGVPPGWDGNASERVVAVLEQRTDYRGAWSARGPSTGTAARDSWLGAMHRHPMGPEGTDGGETVVGPTGAKGSGELRQNRDLGAL